MLTIPNSAIEDWARVFSRVSHSLIDAVKLPLGTLGRKSAIARASKLYFILPQAILRHPGRSYLQNSNIVRLRLDQFLRGDFNVLLNHWAKDVLKERRRIRKPRNDSEEKQIGRASGLITSGSISRGLRIIEGSGCAPTDDPTIRAQMITKHPRANNDTVWPLLPSEWILAAADHINLTGVEKIIRETDPHTGVGTRGLRPDHVKVLFEGAFRHDEAKAAADSFIELGTLYLGCGLPPWLRRAFGGGLLTALIKNVKSNGTIDARPIKAEDQDTSAWCKALARTTAPATLSKVAPQQLGVGVSGGVDLYVIGYKMKYEEAVSNGIPRVIVATDQENCNNSFPRQTAVGVLIEAAKLDSLLIPLALAAFSTLRAPNPIYMRSTKLPSGFDYICNSECGGGQGNAITGQVHVLNQDAALKATEAQFPGVEVKAIHDDVTIEGPPELVFGDNGENGALGFLVKQLEACGQTMNLNKFACVGSTPDACSGKPVWLDESTEVTDKDGNVIAHARGIMICKNPVGEPAYIETALKVKFENISSAITKSSNALLSTDPHAAFLAFTYSYQCRADYFVNTNSVSVIAPFCSELDRLLESVLSAITGFDLFAPSTHTLTQPFFLADRSRLPAKVGGLAYRPYEHRALLLNTLNNLGPTAINHTLENGTIIPGLWNSLGSILGETSFDFNNRNICWHALHSSGSIFGTDHEAQALEFKLEYDNLLVKLELDPIPGYALNSDVAGIGFGILKLHKHLQNGRRNLYYECLVLDAGELPKDDFLARAFLDTRDNQFANAFPLNANPDIRFTPSEFSVAMARKLGSPIASLLAFVGARINNSGRSNAFYVDAHGHGLASATGCKGDHPRNHHDRLVAYVASILRSQGVIVRGGGGRGCTVKDIFAHCIHSDPAHPVNETDRERLQGIIPDLLIDGRSLSNGGDTGPFKSTIFDGRQTLGEMKTLSRRDISLPARALQIQKDIVDNARKLDETYPGSTVSEELKRYGVDGKYLALVAGPFGNLSNDFVAVASLYARERAKSILESRNSKPSSIFAMCKHSVTCRLGLFAARGWAQLILDRNRDLVGPRRASADFAFPDPDFEATEAFNFSHPRHTQTSARHWAI